jgi:hypothetical protein
MAELPEWIGLEPQGNGRDVLWCHVVNEPAFLHLNLSDDRRGCVLCGWDDFTDEERTTAVHPTAWADSHPFVCHIYKPRP